VGLLHDWGGADWRGDGGTGWGRAGSWRWAEDWGGSLDWSGGWGGSWGGGWGAGASAASGEEGGLLFLGHFLLVDLLDWTALDASENGGTSATLTGEGVAGTTLGALGGDGGGGQRQQNQTLCVQRRVSVLEERSRVPDGEQTRRQLTKNLMLRWV